MKPLKTIISNVYFKIIYIFSIFLFFFFIIITILFSYEYELKIKNTELALNYTFESVNNEIKNYETAVYNILQNFLTSKNTLKPQTEKIYLNKLKNIKTTLKVINLNYYFINEKGIVYDTDYSTDLNLDLSIFKNFWKEISSIKVGETLIKSITFETLTGKTRLYGYTKLSNGSIFEIGILFENFNTYFNKKLFNNPYLKNEHFKVKTYIGSISLFEKKYPKEKYLYLKNSLKSTVILNTKLFEKTYYIGKSFGTSNYFIEFTLVFKRLKYIFYLIIFATLIFLIFTILMYNYIKNKIKINITKPTKQLSNNMKNFVLTNTIGEDIKTNISEIFNIYINYKKMATEIIENKEEMLATNEELEASYQKLYEKNNELENSYKKLEELNKTLDLKVAEKTKEILNSKEKIMQAEKLSSLSFLIMEIAHQLNTPIGVSITGTSFMLEQLEEKIKKCDSSLKKDLLDWNNTINIVLKNLLKSANILNTFKNISTTKSDELLSIFDIKTLIINTLNFFDLKDIKVMTEIPKMNIKGYPGVLKQIFTILITNTLEYAFPNNTFDKKIIKVNVKKKDDKLLIEYSDNGIGINEDTLKKIFEPYYTTSKNKDGLGLYIVYNLVKNTLNGEIICESHINQGTLFKIKF
ncbi:hypothetical protein OSSY52_02250 [Tepiditoga spiralis]|uniref:histidine kinase n=1 Tax=Tepiditoga spiralis TaxID=2108365 RepID=A0A7G1G4Y8_9BACT|nr:ATP-binding protein [Tepiditoga spiralis]BBE30084.1 hypothetical protein OSSY52_02250 [Tepiditoga spiralis]